MKILQVIDRIQIGGAEQVFIDIVNLLVNEHKSSQTDVLLLISTEISQIERLPKSINIFQINRNWKLSPIKLYQTYKIIRRYNVIHVHMRHNLRYINLIKFIFRLNTYVVFHDHHFVSKINLIHTFFLFKIVRPDHFITVTNSVSNWMVNKHHINKESITTLVNLPGNRITNYIKYRDVNTGSAAMYDLVYVSNIKRTKNQLFAANLADVLKLKLALVGNNQDFEYFEMLKSKFDIEIVEQNLNPFALVDKSKFGICTSPNESGPLVILEYFVLGIPFLAYKTGGISEILEKYVPEYFLDTFEINDWITRYEELNNNYKRISRKLINNVLECEFNRDIYLMKLLEIYSKSLKCDY